MHNHNTAIMAVFLFSFKFIFSNSVADLFIAERMNGTSTNHVRHVWKCAEVLDLVYAYLCVVFAPQREIRPI